MFNLCELRLSVLILHCSLCGSLSRWRTFQLLFVSLPLWSLCVFISNVLQYQIIKLGAVHSGIWHGALILLLSEVTVCCICGSVCICQNDAWFCLEDVRIGAAPLWYQLMTARELTLKLYVPKYKYYASVFLAPL